MMKPWGGPLKDMSSPGDEARGIAIAKAFVQHLDELMDRLADQFERDGEDRDDYLNGFDRAMGEASVNLHYFIDGRLPREESK